MIQTRKNVFSTMTIACIAASALLTGPVAAQGPPPGDPLVADMFVAITQKDTNALRAALDKGAKIEGENWLGITGLMWATWSKNEDAVRLLLERGANVNHDTIYGGALEAADMGGSPAIFELLLKKGAHATTSRLDKINAVMLAAEAGHLANLKNMLALKPNLEASDATGMTALMHGARRGQNACVALLLASGAKVDATDSFGRTALMYAAQSGDAATVRALVAKGASLTRRDKNGDTPLLLAARYNGDPEIAQILRSTQHLKDAKGRTAREIAKARGNDGFAVALGRTATPKGVRVALQTVSDRTVTVDVSAQARRAVLKSLPLIEKANATFSAKASCGSCHHQGVGMMVTGTAKEYGYKIDSLLAMSQEKVVTGLPETLKDDLKKLVPHPEGYRMLPSVDMNEATPGFTMQFTGLAAHNIAPSEALGSMATILMRLQWPDGAWSYGLHRAPLQSSRFAMTAYTLRTVTTYLPSDMASERDERVARAIEWLTKTPAKNGEDRAFRLLALKWANAPQSAIAGAISDLRKAQRKDGGWSQFDTADEAGPRFTKSDAYATGEALYALHLGGGVATNDDSYRRGVAYLLRTQDDDGSWFINKRAIPANNYLDAGFPHGESQYSSYSGTCFATMALMFAAQPAPRPVAIAKPAPTVQTTR